MRKLYSILPMLGAMLFMAACDDDGNEPTPAIGVSIGGPITVLQGQTGSTAITVTRTGGFEDAVTLAASNLPTGVTASFDPASIPAGSGNGTSTLTLTAEATATTGTANYTVTATGTGVTAATATGSVTVNEAPNFTLAVAPTTLSVQQGASGQANITITRTGGFAGAVDLSVANLPTGVTAAFDNAAPTGNAAVLTLSVSGAATPGTTTLTINGTGTPGTRSVDLALTVTAPANGFVLSLNPTTLSVQAGGNGQTTVNINKTGSFTGDVTLSATGLPANVTATFNPPAASPPRSSTRRDVQTQSTLTLTVAGSVTPNNYPIVIHGTATGQTEQTADLTLTVTAAPGPGNANFKFCDLDNLPIWFAFQDGTGAWTAVTGAVAADGTTYTFNITQATGGVAWVVGNATDGFTTLVFFETQAQLIGTGTAQCTTNPNATRTLNGTVAGVGATDQVTVFMGGGTASPTGAQPAFQLKGVRNGPADLLATQSLVTLAPVAITPTKMIIRRGLDIADGGTILVLDFAAAEAFAPQTAQITFNNLGTDLPFATLGYQTPTTTGAFYTLSGTGATQTVYGVPAAQQQASDLHFLIALAANQATTGDARGHQQWFKTLADMPVTLGPVLTAPTVTSLGNNPYPRYQSTGPIQAEYDDGFALGLIQTGATGVRIWTITATRGYFAGTDYTLAMPDMSAAGFMALWGLQVGTAVQVSTTAFGFSGNTSTPPNVEGGFADFAVRSQQVTP